MATHIRNLRFWDTTNRFKPNSLIVITGGASGIALNIALIYAQRQQCKIILLDLNVNGLNEAVNKCRNQRLSQNQQQQQKTVYTITELESVTASTSSALSSIIGLQLNCTDPSAVNATFSAIIHAYGDIDLLVLCAGIGAHHTFTSGFDDLNVYNGCMQVNFFGYLYCIKAAFASLCRGRGHLVAITSFSGEIGLPFRSAYCSSKFAVTGLLESLRNEMKAAEMSPSPSHPPLNEQQPVTTATANSSFDITIVCPPTINTNLRRNSLKASTDSIEEKPSPHAMTVEKCAAAIVDAADRRLRKAFFPLNSFLANYLRPFMPDTMDALILKKAKL